VTALFEIVPAGGLVPDPGPDPAGAGGLAAGGARRYGGADPAVLDEVAAVHLRYRRPEAVRAEDYLAVVRDEPLAFDELSDDHRLSVAVAAFGLVLRRSPDAGSPTWAELREWAMRRGEGPQGEAREAFLALVERAEALAGGPGTAAAEEQEPAATPTRE
jgi:Ca-activated chloride channel family protein